MKDTKTLWSITMAEYPFSMHTAFDGDLRSMISVDAMLLRSKVMVLRDGRETHATRRAGDGRRL